MKTALVTGAAGGIGYAVVKELATKGIFVYGMDIVDENAVSDRNTELQLLLNVITGL